jgi:hypothetical protein
MIDVINIVTNFELFSERVSYIYICWLLFVFLEKSLHGFCFIRISEQVGKKSTVRTYRSAKFLLKNKSTKHNK